MNEIDINNLEETPERCEKCGRSDVELCFEYVFNATARLCPHCEREWAIVQYSLPRYTEWCICKAKLTGLRDHGREWNRALQSLEDTISNEVAAELALMQAFCRWLGESNDEHEN